MSKMVGPNLQFGLKVQVASWNSEYRHNFSRPLIVLRSKYLAHVTGKHEYYNKVCAVLVDALPLKYQTG